MQQYLNLLREVLIKGEEKSDRTGTGTLSIFGAQMRFDLRDGFPLVTTKKVHFKSIVHELLWFLRGDTNVEYLNDNGVTIWDEWRRPYSLDRDVVFLDAKVAEHVPYFGDFSWKGMNTLPESMERKLMDTWIHMMRRCYDPQHHRYGIYGGAGVSVCEAWHDPATFVQEVQKIPHWQYKLHHWNDFELDKDYYGASQYGPDTSVWLRKDENNLYTKAAKPVCITDASGLTEFFICLNEAARRKGIPNSTLSRFIYGMPSILKGANKAFIGWEFSEAALDGKLPRLALIPDGELGPVYGKQWRSWPASEGRSIDQLAQVIDQIRTNPDSRRHIVSAWNVAEIPNMALAPCHCLFQFYAVNGRLSCQLYQRSADLFLGTPMNIASYALLTHMVAQVCDLDVGDFIWTGGDCHIYLNHVDQVLTQIERGPYNHPQLLLDRSITDIDDFRAEHITLVNYRHHPAIKGDVAV